MKKLFLLSFILCFFMLSSAQGSTVFFQGFETDADGWIKYNSPINRVSSGTDGIASSSGSFHAIISEIPDPDDSKPENSFTGAFTRFDGYRDTWTGGFTASIDIYLDTTWSPGSGFDYSVAANGSDGDHQRDFIFHVTSDTSTGNLLVGGNNNSNFEVIENLEESINYFSVTSSGWYTFQHDFYDYGDGTLACDLNLKDANGNVLYTETRNSPADVLATEIGGNRYGWFTFVDVEGGLAVDNTELNAVPIPAAAWLFGTGILGLVGLRRKQLKGRS